MCVFLYFMLVILFNTPGAFDTQWVACGDMQNVISVFRLSGDSHVLHAVLPRFDSMHCEIAFQPNTSHFVVSYLGMGSLIFFSFFLLFTW